MTEFVGEMMAFDPVAGSPSAALSLPGPAPPMAGRPRGIERLRDSIAGRNLGEVASGHQALNASALCLVPLIACDAVDATGEALACLGSGRAARVGTLPDMGGLARGSAWCSVVVGAGRAAHTTGATAAA